jgi:uncharacterized membrane protein HdeD (DUF308 family)
MTMLATPDAASLGGRWKLFFGVGAVLAILGVLALTNVVSATLVTAFLVGVLLLVGGLAQIVAAFMMNGSAGMRILTGLLGALYLWIGANVIAEPLKGVLLLTVVLGISLIVGGVLRLIAAFTGGPGNRVLPSVVGAIDLVLGIWVLTGIPITGLAIGFFLGIELLMAGVLWMFLAWGARDLAEGRATAAA